MSETVVKSLAKSARASKQSTMDRVFMWLGDIGGKHQPSDEEAIKYGKRRALVAGLALTAVLGVKTAIGLEHGAETHQAKVEKCSGEILGHAVKLVRNVNDGSFIVPAIEYTAVTACEVAGGDVQVAREKMPDIQKIDANQP